MEVFESIIGLLLAAVALAGLARRLGAPYPSLLALGGAALALVPGAPEFILDPDLTLALFVAPVLLDAAFDASPRDLRDNWMPVAGLVVGAVGLTTVAAAWVARLFVPEMPWAAAVALGAIVAPPDAAAATAVLRQVRPPHRILTILEGESLLNDASALLIYRLAVGAASAHMFSIAGVAPAFLLAVAGSLIAGPLLARLFLPVTERVADPPSAIMLQFIGTFGVWILAERLGLSGVLTVVCFAIAIARRAPEMTPARLRVPSYAVWETAVFVLNVLAFVLIGLQIRPILESLAPETRVHYLIVASTVLAAVIAVRFAWVLSARALGALRIRVQGYHPPRPMQPPTFGGAVLIAWCGMRGVVSLAAALALPAAFPFRDLIVFIAFSVVLGTLVLQGLTLTPLLKWLDLRDDDPVGREVAVARAEALQAALTSLDHDTSPSARRLRREYAALLRGAVAGRREGREQGQAVRDLRRRALAAARHRLAVLRDTDVIGDDAFHRLEEELDWLEMSVR